jgi:hypothetical protein
MSKPKAGGNNADNKGLEVVPGEWAAKRLLGPTFDEIGADLQTLYKKGRDRLINRSIGKIGQDNVASDNLKANLRVTRDVFWNGIYNDELICAEYFSGVLAQSRTADGKDDRGVFYLDIIKSLSSNQLLAHWLIYSSGNRLLVDKGLTINVARDQALANNRIYIRSDELRGNQIVPEIDVPALGSKGLVGYYSGENQTIDDQSATITTVEMTPLGVQLYAVAANRLNEWLTFDSQIFDGFMYDEVLDSASLDLATSINA